MAQLKATTFSELTNLFQAGFNGKLGHNTFCREAGDAFIVTLHQSDIVKVFRDHVEFTLAGFNTVTTRERINQFLPRGVGVSTRKGQALLTMWDVDNPEIRDSKPFNDFGWFGVAA